MTDFSSVPPQPMLPVDPYRWQFLFFNLALMAATWVLLWLWLVDGVEGAGNLYGAWLCFGAVCITVSAVTVGKVKRLSRCAPLLVRAVFRVSSVAQLGLLIWHGHWFLGAVSFWCLLCTMKWRQSMAERIAAQEAAAG